MYRIILRDKFKTNIENIEIEELSKFDERNMAVNGMNRNLQRNISLFYDNLKPVQRRILFAMAKMKLWPNSEYDSCAGIVGETLKRYHPHGDQACYTALVYMAQPWRQLIPLVDIKGNYGNADDVTAFAQMRYVKARLSEFAKDCFFDEWDLKSNLVDMSSSFNGHDTMPAYLPAKYPYFLMGWGSGMGYGISTTSPGFLPQDAFNAVITLMENPDADIVLYPEDPLGCTILDKEVFKKFVDYVPPKDEKKNLIFRVRSTYSVKDNIIIVHNTPYEVSPSAIYERIKSLTKDNKLEGLYDMEIKLKEGSIPQLGNAEDTAEIILELKKGYDPHIMMDKLYKLTGLETSYPLNCVYVNANKTVKLNLRNSILDWIQMRRKVLKRLYRLDLNANQKKISVLDALIMLFETNSIEKVVKIIKGSKRDEVCELLIKQFKINDYQAKQIASMKLSDLSTDSYEDYKKERKELSIKVDELQDILRHKKNIDKIIKKQMEEGIKKYSRQRLSKIISALDSDNIDDSSYSICITDTGYIKKLPVYTESFGKLVEDSELIFMDSNVSNQSKIVTFNSAGKVFEDFVHKVPKSKLDGVGYHMKKLPPSINNLVGAVIISSDDTLSSAICVTKNGIIKRSNSSDYFSASSNSLGIKIGKNDSLVSVLQSSSKNDCIVIYTKNGRCVLYRIDTINKTARATSGVSGIKLEEGDEVIGAKVVRKSDTHLITISTKGELKKFSFEITFGTTKRGDVGIEVMPKGENIYNLIPMSLDDKSINIITSRSNDSEIISISDIPTKTRISAGDKMLNVRRGKELIKINK